MIQTGTLPEVPCPDCGVLGRVTRFVRDEVETIRGIEVQASKILRRCDACSVEFENTNDPDWRPAAYANYRAIAGLLSPEEIVLWRKSYGLTQQDVTNLLGWGDVTLGRYEKGALQSEAHDKALRTLMEPGHLAEALAENPKAVPPDRRQAVFAKMRVEQKLLSPEELRIIRLKYGLSEILMGRLISVPGQTWQAWEAGEGLPSQAVNVLLRIVARRPSVVRDLLGDAGVESDAAQEALQEFDKGVSEQVALNLRERHEQGADASSELVREVQEEIQRVQPEVAARVLGRAA